MSINCQVCGGEVFDVKRSEVPQEKVESLLKSEDFILNMGSIPDRYFHCPSCGNYFLTSSAIQREVSEISQNFLSLLVSLRIEDGEERIIEIIEGVFPNIKEFYENQKEILEQDGEQEDKDRINFSVNLREYSSLLDFALVNSVFLIYLLAKKKKVYFVNEEQIND